MVKRPRHSSIGSLYRARLCAGNLKVTSYVRLQDNFGKPAVHRSFAQISQQARQLREDLGLVSTHAERSAASDLLSGAVDTIALSKQLGQFQVEPELAAPEPQEAGSVQEFVEKLRQRNLENAIQVSFHVCLQPMLCRYSTRWSLQW